MRLTHVTGGLSLLGLGVFLLLQNILYVVDWIKGAVQPAFILIGLAAAGCAIFRGNGLYRKINAAVAVVFLVVGCYGVYDEYYPTIDFLHGLFPPALIVAGIFSLSHGIGKLKC